MKELINAIMAQLTFDRTLDELTQITGLQKTRIHRLRSQTHKPTAEELVALSEAFNVSIDSLITSKVTEARAQAYQEVYEKAEIKVAEKYGITTTQLAWRLQDPKLREVI